MKADDRQPSAGLQRRFGGGQAALQLAQLVVHADADRLEAARRRIARIAKQVHAFSLHLVGNGADVPIATVVTAKGFESACKTALRAFSGTFKNLELPGYAIKEQRGDSVPLENLMNRN